MRNDTVRARERGGAGGCRILGIDPGLNITGYGVLLARDRRFQLHEAGVIRGGSSRDMGRRVAQIYQGLCEVIDQTEPDSIAIEELYSHYQRPRTAILMGHARGVICLAAANHDIPVVGYSATQIKKILTGSGRAPKNQIQQAVQRELGLEQTPDPPDVADALAIAMCHGYLGPSQRSKIVATSTVRSDKKTKRTSAGGGVLRRNDHHEPPTQSSQSTADKDSRTTGSARRKA